MKWERNMRETVLHVAAWPWLKHWMEHQGLKYVVRRFVAGTTLTEALVAVKQLRADGLMVTLDLLGESVEDEETARLACHSIEAMMNHLRQISSDSHISIKLTQLGLIINPALCEQNMHKLLETARTNGQFIRIDMEDSSVTGQTLELFSKLHMIYGPKHIGVVVQSYLYRTPADVETLQQLGASVRIVKGAYSEPPEVAYPEKCDVDLAYFNLVCSLLQSESYTAIATHDRILIANLIRFIAEQDIDRDRFEFQMLYGIATDLQHQLVHEGYRIRIYTPFGTHWYPYFSRRLAERPANLWFVLRHLLPPMNKF